MTTDERLDRLAERTDAIAQSVELLTTLHRDSNNRWLRALARPGRGSPKRPLGLPKRSALSIVWPRSPKPHEQRLDHLEG